MPARTDLGRAGVAIQSPHQRPDRLRPRCIEHQSPGCPIQPNAGAAGPAPPARADPGRPLGRALPASAKSEWRRPPRPGGSVTLADPAHASLAASAKGADLA